MKGPSVIRGTLRKHPFRDYAGFCADRVVEEGRRAPVGHVSMRTFDGRTGTFYEPPSIPVPALTPPDANVRGAPDPSRDRCARVGWVVVTVDERLRAELDCCRRLAKKYRKHLTGDRDEDDAVQLALISTWHAAEAFDDDGRTLLDLLAGPIDTFEIVDLALAVAQLTEAMEALPATLRFVLERRLAGDEHTEIGRALGVSRQMAQRHEANAIQRLRRAAQARAALIHQALDIAPRGLRIAGRFASRATHPPRSSFQNSSRSIPKW